MAIILITAASSRLGQLTVAELLEQSVSPTAISVTVCDLNKVKGLDWASRGIEVRRADYNDPDAWTSDTLKGFKRLLLIAADDLSSNDGRFRGHLNVINGATAAEVKFIAYTSILHAQRNETTIAKGYAETEDAIRRWAGKICRTRFHH